MRLLVSLVTLAAIATPALAHSWYSQKRDPIFSTTTCCGGLDCAPLPAHAMSYTPEGDLRVTLTLEEAQRINPARRSGFDRIISFDRIQVSDDGQPHICLQPYEAPEDPREGYYCIFLPAQW